MKKLVALRKQHRALRVGDFRLIESEKLFAFERHTDRVLETVLVFSNPTDQAVTERVMVAHAELMDDTPLHDLFKPQAQAAATFGSGFVTVTVPPKTTLVLQPKEKNLGGYSRYKRVK
jgi:hypothetical protein